MLLPDLTDRRRAVRHLRWVRVRMETSYSSTADSMGKFSASATTWQQLTTSSATHRNVGGVCPAAYLITPSTSV